MGENQANVIVRQWMKEYPNQIEVIISNNDDMALGAWEALEEKGCTEVQVVGIDGIEEVRELVRRKIRSSEVFCVIQNCMQSTDAVHRCAGFS